jgi:hypothetical protein
MPVTYRVGGRVPDIMLPRAGGEPGRDVVPARGRPREGVALLFPDGSGRWPGYLRRLADLAPELADWDGRVIAVAPAADSSARPDGADGGWAGLARELGARVWIVDDPEGALRPAAGGEHALPTAAIVDRYGEIYHVWPRDPDAASPAPEPRELEEWLRYLALQCPE